MSNTDFRTHDKRGHYYVQTLGAWATGDSLMATIKRVQKQAGSLKPKSAKIFYVPLPQDAKYQHSQGGGPDVEGVAYLGHVTL